LEQSRNSKLLFGLLLISLTFMMLLITPPAAYADDSGLPSVPAMPPATGKFPGYHPVNTTGVPSLPNPPPRTSPPPALPPWTGYPEAACSTLGFSPEGIATVPGGQVFVDYYTGNWWFYSTASKTCSLIQTPPPGHSTSESFGVAAKGSLVATISIRAEGLWTCTLTSSDLCKSSPVFVSLPSSFCSTMTSGFCDPLALAFDKTGNLWYTDAIQGWEVELTKASGYSKVGATRSYCSPGLGCELEGMVIDSAGNHWVSDHSCTGNVYENGKIVFSAGDLLWGITISSLNPSKKAHLYVAVTNACGNYPYPFVGDATDLTILPHPYSSGSDYMCGISTQLYFTDVDGYVWLTREP